MTRRGVDAAGITRSPAGQGRADGAVSVVGGTANPGSAGRASPRKAGMHRRVASQVSGLMQGNAVQREDLRRRLAVLEIPSAAPAAAATAAALKREIGILDRIIAWQAATAAWHLSEARRLWDQAARAGRLASPRADSGTRDRRNPQGAAMAGPCGPAMPRCRESRLAMRKGEG